MFAEECNSVMSRLIDDLRGNLTIEHVRSCAMANINLGWSPTLEFRNQDRVAKRRRLV
jgi:hypothetical protein